MNCQSFFAYAILIAFSYFYDFVTVGPNKITYDPQHLDYSAFSAISNVFWGALIFYSCSIGYNTLSWVLTAITFMSVVSVLMLNLFKVKVDVSPVAQTATSPPATKETK